MSLTISEAIKRPAVCLLQILSHIVQKGQQYSSVATGFANDGREDPSSDSLLEARLHPTMKPLSFQIHMATIVVEQLVARLSSHDASTEIPTKLDWGHDALSTFDKALKQINSTLNMLRDADPEVLNAGADTMRVESLKSKGAISLTGRAFACGGALPTIYFHVVTAYGILRKEGVELKKWDYMEEFVAEYY